MNENYLLTDAYIPCHLFNIFPPNLLLVFFPIKIDLTCAFWQIKLGDMTKKIFVINFSKLRSFQVNRLHGADNDEKLYAIFQMHGVWEERQRRYHHIYQDDILVCAESKIQFKKTPQTNLNSHGPRGPQRHCTMNKDKYA